MKMFMDNFETGIKNGFDSYEEVTSGFLQVSGMKAYRIIANVTDKQISDSQQYLYLVCFVDHGTLYTFGLICNESYSDEYKMKFENLLGDITLKTGAEVEGSILKTEETVEINSNDEVYSETETITEKQTGTAEQSNALKRALSYLDFAAFSREGLIDQLEYEGFSIEDATHAVDNCNADWEAQALKKAESYLSISAFSYQGLIDQLEYEGFTSEEAIYGVDNCGADWNQQAVEKAKSYLEYSSFSRDELIDQLEYDGFTHDQAIYGVEENGY